MQKFCNLPQDNSALMPVAYTPKWVPAGFNTDPNTRNRFINRLNKKQFSVFINNPNTLNLPDGTYSRENFVLIKKTHYHGDRPHTIAVFGDIDIESGKKILNSIEVKH
jgi:negative regulator of sigma E activity